MMIEALLTLTEAAASLGVCQKTVKRLLAEGRVDGCRLPEKRRIYFLASEVERVREQGMRKRGRPRKASDQTDRTDPSDRR